MWFWNFESSPHYCRRLQQFAVAVAVEAVGSPLIGLLVMWVAGKLRVGFACRFAENVSPLIVVSLV